MKVVKCNDGSIFYVSELFDKEFEIISIKIEERLFGDIPTIDIKLRCNEQPCQVDDLVKGYLISKDGLKTEFSGFVYTVEYMNNELTAKILCCSPDFVKNKFVTKYTTIDNAIESTSQMARIDNPLIKTDLLDFQDPWYIYQKNITNYKLCTKLCTAYKHNTIFGYLMNGLLFKDLANWTPEIEATDRDQINLTNPTSWQKPKMYDQQMNFTDYNSKTPEYEVDENHTFVTQYETIIPTNVPYKELIGNFVYNQRLANSQNTNNFKQTFISDWSVGQFIKIKSPQINFKNCFISARTINISKALPQVEFTIKSIELES